MKFKRLTKFAIFRRTIVETPGGGWQERVELADVVRTYRSMSEVFDDVFEATSGRDRESTPIVMEYGEATRRCPWLLTGSNRVKVTMDRVRPVDEPRAKKKKRVKPAKGPMPGVSGALAEKFMAEYRRQHAA